MPTVMVVHESWTMREILKEDLAACGYQVIYNASSCLETALMYRLHRPDVVLVDTVSNQNSGIQTIDNVLDVDPSATIIVLVSTGEDNTALRALVSGAQGLLVIPFTADALQHELDRVTKPRSKSSLIHTQQIASKKYTKLISWISFNFKAFTRRTRKRK